MIITFKEQSFILKLLELNLLLHIFYLFIKLNIYTSNINFLYFKDPINEILFFLIKFYKLIIFNLKDFLWILNFAKFYLFYLEIL